MDRTVAQIYHLAPDTALSRIEETIASTLSDTPPDAIIPTFFRADDIGVISKNFLDMLNIFEKHRMPLCLAVVPAWLTQSRWETIQKHTDPSLPLWCWHQHGWNHTNHEAAGKKYEFGSSRSDNSIKADLERGRKKLEMLIGSDFSPFFTPPWNRCSSRTLDILHQLQFHGISRSRGEQKNPAPLPDIFVNVDLHTRKETKPTASLYNLCGEFEQAIKDGHVGVMLHHQRMNGNALAFLDGLLEIISRHCQLLPTDFTHFPNRNE